MRTSHVIDRISPPVRADTHPSRDHEMVATLARHGLLTMPLLMAAMRSSRTVTYRRFARLAEAGLVEGVTVPGVGALRRATREGQRYVGLGGLPLALARPGDIAHDLRCAGLAVRLEGEGLADDARLLTVRELQSAERVEGRTIASAPIEQHGREGLHRPDLAIIGADRVIACEVELTIKAPRRLEQIMRAWRRASHVAEVRYLCGSAGVRRAVERAVAATYASERVRIEDLAR